MKNKTTYTRDSKTNSISFFRNGKRVYDFTISGNVVSFDNGDFILL
jgi:hypothetical protein